MEKKELFKKLGLLIIALVAGLGGVVWAGCVSVKATLILLISGTIMNVFKTLADKINHNSLLDKDEAQIKDLNNELKESGSNDRVEMVQDVPIFETISTCEYTNPCTECPDYQPVPEQAITQLKEDIKEVIKKPKKKSGPKPKKKKS